jgi:hypothetical protein
MANNNPTEALKSFATLSLIYKDEAITPRALASAAAAADLLGDKTQAAGFRKKLAQDYPGFAAPAPAE